MSAHFVQWRFDGHGQVYGNYPEKSMQGKHFINHHQLGGRWSDLWKHPQTDCTSNYLTDVLKLCFPATTCEFTQCHRIRIE